MILISKVCLSWNIWPETSDETDNPKDMIKIVWIKKAHYPEKVSGIKTYLLSSMGKEAKHMRIFIFYYVTIWLLNWHRFWIQL